MSNSNEYLNKLDKEISELSAFVASGTANNFESYTGLCGIIEGFRRARVAYIELLEKASD